MIVSASSILARRADRGALDGVTADDIRAQMFNKPAAPAAEQPKSETIVIVEEAVPAKAAAPAQCPLQASEECPIMASFSDFKVFPIFTGESTEKAFTTQLGKNWVAAGASVSGLFYTGSPKSQKLGGGALLEASINAFNADNDTWGLDLTVPVSYEYMSISSNDDAHRVSFPLMFRPYYRFDFGDGFVITPYLNCGAGGAYTYLKSADSASKNLAFVWIVGGGVEFSFLGDFSVTPKYEWYNTEDSSNDYYQAPGVEFAWKFAKNMTLVAEYNCRIYQEANMYSHIGLIKVRYDF